MKLWHDLGNLVSVVDSTTYIPSELYKDAFNVNSSNLTVPYVRRESLDIYNLDGDIIIPYDSSGNPLNLFSYEEDSTWVRIEDDNRVDYKPILELNSSGLNLMLAELDDIHQQGKGHIDSFIELRPGGKHFIVFRVIEDWREELADISAINDIESYLIISIENGLVDIDFLDVFQPTGVLFKLKLSEGGKGKKIVRNESPLEVLSSYEEHRKENHQKLLQTKEVFFSFTEIAPYIVGLFKFNDKVNLTSKLEYSLALSNFISEQNLEPALENGNGSLLRMIHAVNHYLTFGTVQRNSALNSANKFLSSSFRGNISLLLEKNMEQAFSMLIESI